ncbi:Uncharacterized conserved protein (some members contain a von Willebrand factor type A (vWA) domain) [Alteromonadaceae bacterium Bs31]|nr:Uncharacterized conserved protein (some members contain a von Willebrand factor type A (vWA) domain) [Alteromonadaceae bacterium Bs31]
MFQHFKKVSHSPSHATDGRVYTQLSELIKLEHFARGFSFKPTQPSHSPLTGRHSSRLRGRGLNFEELRHYRVGDDIRTMDWKVTNRTGKPHVRVYTEERERNVFILLDQRISMFFGSEQYMKSVVAAEIAALIAWRVSSMGDKVGGVIFNDSDIYSLRPQRSRSHVMQWLSKIVAFNTALKAGIQAQPKKQNAALKKLLPLLTHDSLLILISDGNGWTEADSRNIRKLSQHNDVIAVNVVDAGEQKLPGIEHLVVSDGSFQISLNSTEKTIQKAFDSQLAQRFGLMERALKQADIPLLTVNTLEPAHVQLARLLGGNRS